VPVKTNDTCRREQKQFPKYYRSADKSLARPTSRCILFDGENISFGASLVKRVYINSTNIPPIMIINKIYEHQSLLFTNRCTLSVLENIKIYTKTYIKIAPTCFDVLLPI
jgi:hypothetical protein